MPISESYRDDQINAGFNVDNRKSGEKILSVKVFIICLQCLPYIVGIESDAIIEF